MCDCLVPDNAVIAHNRGRKHNALRFFGPENASAMVNNIKLLCDVDGQVTRELRPYEVPDIVVALARRARALVLPTLVAHSGVDQYQRVCGCFGPERLCARLLAFDETWLRPPRPPGGASACELELARADAEQVLCVSALLVASPAVGPRPVEVDLTAPRGSDAFSESAAMSAALCALARQLPCCAPGSRVSLRLAAYYRGAQQERRFVGMLVDSLVVGLRSSAGVAALALETAGSWREQDTERLREAASQSWCARVWPLLLGARFCEASPLAKLTPDLLRHIVDLVGREGRAVVCVTQACTAAAAPTPARPPTFGGDDLARLAALIS